MTSAIDPSVIIDNVKVEKDDLRNQLTIAKNEISALQGQILATGQIVESRTALKAFALPTVNTAVTTLGDSAADGRNAAIWIFVDGNQSSAIAGDPEEAQWSAPDVDPTGVSGAWKRITADPFAFSVSLTLFSTDLTATGVFTDAVNKAIDFIAARSGGRGGIIEIPAGVFIETVPASRDYSTNEGHGVVLEDIHSNITFRGAGRESTFIKPATNTMGLFLQLGADNIVYEDITFDNRDNGVLQNLDNTVPWTPLGGLDSQGNGLNYAIRQALGLNTTVRRCNFFDFNTNLNHQGDYTDKNQAVGNLVVESVIMDGGAFGVVIQQCQTLVYTDWAWNNGVDNIRPTGTDDGHGLYVAGRDGATPDSIIVANFSGKNSSSSICKIRKGGTTSVTNFSILGSHRGVEIWNVESAVVSNGSVRLARVNLLDTSASGIELSDCANYEVDNVVVDRSDAIAWGVRVRKGDESGSAPHNMRGRVKGITVIDDLSTSTTKAAVIVVDQSDVEIEAPIYRITGNVAHTAPVVEVQNSTRIHIRRPKKRTAEVGNPSGSLILVELDAATINCVVEYSRDDLDATPTVSTVNDLGTGNRILRVDGSETIDWTPSLTFQTPGGLVLSNVVADGWIEKRGTWATVGCYLEFDTNAHTGSGEVRITGFPYAAHGLGRPFSISLSAFDQIVATSDVLGARIGDGNTYFVLRDSDLGGSGTNLDATAIPPSTAGFVIEFQLRMRIAET